MHLGRRKILRIDDVSGRVRTRLNADRNHVNRHRMSAFEPIISAPGVPGTPGVRGVPGGDGDDEDLVTTDINSHVVDLPVDRETAGAEDDGDAAVRLEHQELWDKFNNLGTEMVITKSGR